MPIATSPSIDSALLMVKPTVRPTLLKRKQGQPAGDANKRTKTWIYMLVTFNNLSVILANNQMELAWVKSSLNFSPSQIDGRALFPLLIALVFLLNLSYKVKRFFTYSSSIKQLSSLLDFSSSITFWDKRFFFHQQYLWLYLLLPIVIEGFLYQRNTGFPLFLPIGCGGFLTSCK